MSITQFGKILEYRKSARYAPLSSLPTAGKINKSILNDFSSHSTAFLLFILWTFCDYISVLFLKTIVLSRASLSFSKNEDKIIENTFLKCRYLNEWHEVVVHFAKLWKANFVASPVSCRAASVSRSATNARAGPASTRPHARTKVITRGQVRFSRQRIRGRDTIFVCM